MTGAGVSVIVVSDFEGGGQRSWRSEREIFEALAHQDIHRIPLEIPPARCIRVVVVVTYTSHAD
jgi:hypothetical protein